MYHRIRRVRGKDAKLFGVLAGISKYLDPEWDPLITRLIFLILAAFSGFIFMFVLYFVLAIVLHVEEEEVEEIIEEEPKNFRDFRVKDEE